MIRQERTETIDLAIIDFEEVLGQWVARGGTPRGYSAASA